MPAAMSPGTRQATRVALTALGIGALGDAVLRVEPPGVNLTLWLIVITATVLALRTATREVTRQDWWLGAAAAFFAATFSWRDTDALHPLNMLATLVALSLLAFTATGVPRFRVDSAGLRNYVRAGVHAGLSTLGGAIPLFASDLQSREGEPSVWDRVGGARTRAIARGALISVPLLLAFGGLLMSADPVFHRIVTSVLSIEALLWHAFFTALFAWFAAGYLRGALLAREPVGITERPLAFTLGLTETTIVLGALNLLFAAFVLVQFRYLFGGSAVVLAQEGMTFAEYARRGFFELVFVSALVLPVLLLTHELLERGTPGSEQRFRWLARLMLALVFIVMLSALQRMRLYQRAYALTESRLYATAFMLWLAVVFGGFAATILRGRPAKFAVGALVSGWLVLAGLNVLNPSAFVVRTNVARAPDARKLDASYLSTLGTDAVPALAESIRRLPAPAQCGVARRLLSRWGTAVDRRWVGTDTRWQREGESRGWRTANLGRTRAERAVRQHNAQLRATYCPKPVVTPAASPDASGPPPADPPATRASGTVP